MAVRNVVPFDAEEDFDLDQELEEALLELEDEDEDEILYDEEEWDSEEAVFEFSSGEELYTKVMDQYLW